MNEENSFNDAESLYAWYVRTTPQEARQDFPAFARRYPSFEDALLLLHSWCGDVAEAKGCSSFETEARRVLRSETPSVEALAKKDAFHVSQEKRYTVLEILAQTAMSLVLRVLDHDLKREVAMKVLIRGSSREDDPAVQRFLREAEIASSLQHPGVPPVLDRGTDKEGHVFFTMPLVSGKNLMEVILKAEKAGRSLPEVVRVVLQAYEIVAFAHSRGVLHRDLKPQNVMVGAFGEVLVVDWGLSKQKSEERDALPGAAGESRDPLSTLPGSVLGTPSFVPPEQARGDVEALDERSEVYSLGAILYTALSGKAPYLESTSDTHDVILKRVLAGPPVPLENLGRRIPGELVAIVEKAMAREKESRYQNASDLAQDLKAFLENRVVRAHRTGPIVEFKKWVKRNRAVSVSLACGLLLAFAGLVTALVVEVRAKNEILQISDAKTLENLKAEEITLLTQANDLARQKIWLTTADSLLSRRGLHAETVRRLRERGKEEKRQVRYKLKDAHPLQEAHKRIDGHLNQLSIERKRVREGDAPLFKNPEIKDVRIASLGLQMKELRAQKRYLEKLVEETPHFAFPSGKDQWIHDTLSDLVFELELLKADEPFGAYSKAKRFYEAARESAEAHAASWDVAIEDIMASGLYALRRRLEAQVGLVPIGRDPKTGFFEFAHVLSGAIPERGADGKLKLTEETGLVFVLLPGGDVEIGAERNEVAMYFDLDARDDEAPIRKVTLRPFFMSKFEMTQAQWRRVTGENESFFAAGSASKTLSATGLHPIENIHWSETHGALRRIGLTIPTEAQWEYSCRGGTKTPWWCGEKKSLLQGAANLRDSSSEELGGLGENGVETGLSDGVLLHAPVGSFEANPFGLFDICGNVAEWCSDYYAPDAHERAVRNKEAGTRVNFSETRAVRGGSFLGLSGSARSSAREGRIPSIRYTDVGVRPTRVILPQ